jgi:hypothetical protein
VTSQGEHHEHQHTSASRQKLLSAKFVAKATIAALALAGSLAVVTPAAQAQRPGGPGGTTLDAACYQIGQDYVDGVAAFKAAYAAGDQAGRDSAGKKFRGAEDNWKSICEGLYGSLYIASRCRRVNLTLAPSPQHPNQERRQSRTPG